jgi:predicted CoA-substrate-specific enzyme activase
VETLAHFTAVRSFYSDADLIVDVGGQDIKIILVNNGIITDIFLNESCSSGCGSFIDNFCANLNMEVDEIESCILNARGSSSLGSRCTVFMNSNIITAQKNGEGKENILLGLCSSMIENIFTKVFRLENYVFTGKKIVVEGGVFKNTALLRVLEKHIGEKVIRAPYAG